MIGGEREEMGSSLGKKASGHLEAASPRYLLGNCCRRYPCRAGHSLACLAPLAPLACPFLGCPGSLSGPVPTRLLAALRGCSCLSWPYKDQTGDRSWHFPRVSLFPSPLKSSTWIPSHTPLPASAVPPCLAASVSVPFWPCTPGCGFTYCILSNWPHILFLHSTVRPKSTSGWSNLTPPTSLSLPDASQSLPWLLARLRHRSPFLPPSLSHTPSIDTWGYGRPRLLLA